VGSVGYGASAPEGTLKFLDVYALIKTGLSVQSLRSFFLSAHLYVDLRQRPCLDLKRN